MNSDGPHLYLAVKYTELPPNPPIAPAGLINGQPLKMLCSYHYFKGVDMAGMVGKIPGPPMVFADSGAFSAHTQGAYVSVNDYAEWLKKWHSLFTVYVNLDVIRDPAATAANQRALERQGLSPIPVFHTGSPWSALDDLMDRYPYIALGGMVGVSEAQALRWAATCMKRAQSSGTVFHGFGQTRRKVIESLPWYSVDSSSWGMAHRYGRIDVWDGRRFQQVMVGDPVSVGRQARALRAIGINPADISDRSRYHHSYAAQAAAAAWRQYEGWLRRRHGPIRHPQADRNTDGLHLYLADSNAANFEAIQPNQKELSR